MLHNHQQFIKFVMAGGFAALANFISRICLSFYLDYVTAIIIAYLIGMVTAYTICSLWVFTAKSTTFAQQIGYFTLVNVFAVAQTLVFSLVFFNYMLVGIEDVFVRESIAHFIGITIPVFTSFIGHKYVTFK